MTTTTTIGALPVIAGLGILLVEWAIPSRTRREHHAWRTAAYALVAAGFTTWLVADLMLGPLWQAPIDGILTVAYAWRTYDEYRKWRDSDDGPRRRRLRTAGARARALLDRLRARAPNPRPLPVPT